MSMTFGMFYRLIQLTTDIQDSGCFAIPQFMPLICLWFPCPWARRSQVQYLTEVKEPCNRCAASIRGVMYSLTCIAWRGWNFFLRNEMEFAALCWCMFWLLKRRQFQKTLCQAKLFQCQVINLVAYLYPTHIYPSCSNTLWNIRRWARASPKISPRLKSQNWVGGREMTRSWGGGRGKWDEITCEMASFRQLPIAPLIIS